MGKKKESWGEFAERLFWEYDNDVHKADSKRMCFKDYMSKVAIAVRDGDVETPKSRYYAYGVDFKTYRWKWLANLASWWAMRKRSRD